MPKRTDIKSILIIGAGPIIIGQACEFDYSGVQACKALREEGYKVILINSNPATIMTDPAMADATYIEPVEWRTVAKIIEQEKPDALLPTMGGQTALNAAQSVFATYLSTIHNAIHPIFAEEFLGSLSRLGKGGVLQEHLVAKVEIVLSKADGKVVRRGITSNSGSTIFDAAAIDAARWNDPAA